jgi:hypothetical protein
MIDLLVALMFTMAPTSSSAPSRQTTPVVATINENGFKLFRNAVHEPLLNVASYTAAPFLDWYIRRALTAGRQSDAETELIAFERQSGLSIDSSGNSLHVEMHSHDLVKNQDMITEVMGAEYYEADGIRGVRLDSRTSSRRLYVFTGDFDVLNAMRGQLNSLTWNMTLKRFSYRFLTVSELSVASAIDSIISKKTDSVDDKTVWDTLGDRTIEEDDRLVANDFEYDFKCDAYVNRPMPGALVSGGSPTLLNFMRPVLFVLQDAASGLVLELGLHN